MHPSVLACAERLLMQALWPMPFMRFSLVVHRVTVKSVADELEKIVAETDVRVVWTCVW